MVLALVWFVKIAKRQIIRLEIEGRCIQHIDEFWLRRRKINEGGKVLVSDRLTLSQFTSGSGVVLAGRRRPVCIGNANRYRVHRQTTGSARGESHDACEIGIRSVRVVEELGRYEDSRSRSRMWWSNSLICESSIDLTDRPEISLLLLACHLDIIQLQVYNTYAVYIHMEGPMFWGPGWPHGSTSFRAGPVPTHRCNTSKTTFLTWIKCRLGHLSGNGGSWSTPLFLKHTPLPESLEATSM